MGTVCATYSLYLLDLGLSYSQVAFVNGLYFAFVILFELPTGMIADGKGRGYSVIAGAFFMALSGFIYALSGGFAGALVAEAISALGTAFFSGALSAWIADARDHKTSLREIYAKRTMVNGFGSSLGVLVGVYLVASFGREFTFVLHGVFYVIAALFAFTYMRGQELEHPMGEFEALKCAWTHLHASPNLRWSVAVTVLSGFFASYNLFWAPLLFTHFSQESLGWIWIIMYGMFILAGQIVRKGKESLGARQYKEKIVQTFVLIGLAMAFVITSHNPFVWVALIAVHEFGRGLLRPYMEAFVQERVKSQFRATFGSLQSFLGLLGLFGTGMILSALFRFFGSDVSLIPWIWLGTSCLLVLGAGLLWYMRPRECPSIERPEVAPEIA